MKKTTKLFIIITFISALILSFEGCTKAEETITTKPKANDFNISNVVWSIENGILDGERYPLMTITNNSGYTITEFELKLTQKEDVENIDLDTTISDLTFSLELDEEESFEFKTEISNKKLNMCYETDTIIKDGETQKNIQGTYFDSSYEVNNIEHINLVEPDIATIRYVADGKIKKVYYDFKAESYTYDDEEVEAYEWSSNDIATQLPKPKAEIVKTFHENDNEYLFDIFGFKQNDYFNYINECKNNGFTKDIVDNSKSDFLPSWTAKNDNGYSIKISFSSYHNRVTCKIVKD